MNASVHNEFLRLHDGGAEPMRVGRLWSLLEMLEFEGHAFVAAMSRLYELDQLSKTNPDWVYGDHREWFIENLDILIKQITKLRLRLSIRKANYIRTLLTESGTSSAQQLVPLMQHSMGELRERIEQELEERKLYCIDAGREGYLLDPDAPFGDSVSGNFPAIISDISEASFCLAMSRNTGCVFHLMRAMEYIVFELGRELSVTIIDKSNIVLDWGKILSNINGAIEKMPKGDRKNQFSVAAALLYHVKLAWRNETMHPKASYTDAEAESIYLACRSFIVSFSDLVQKS